MRRKKYQEEKESLGWDAQRHSMHSDPRSLPYQGNADPLPLINQTPKAVEVAGSKAAQQEIDWIAFREYLSRIYNSPNTVKVRLCYAKKFYHVLLENNAEDLLGIESQ